jgi:branched-chain amino acid transport system substrate-binding protein
MMFAAVIATTSACSKKSDDTTTTPASATPVPAAPAAKASDATEVKIGHVAPVSGALSHLGQDNENGAHLAVDEINAQGLTIDGHAIRLVLDTRDDAADPKTGVAAAQALVADHVVAAIGNLNSGVSIPAAKIYSDANVAQISAGTTSPDFTQQGFKTTFRVVATDVQQGRALAGYALDTLHAKKMAVIDDGTPYGQSLANEFVKSVEAGGVKVVVREVTNEKARNFKGILNKIKRVQPDAVMFAGMDTAGGPFIKQAAALGIKGKILGGDGVCTDKVAELAGDAVQNLVCTQAGLALSKMDKGADFAQKYDARFHVPVQLYAPYTYDAVYVIVDAMKRANSVEAPKVLAAIASTDYNGLTGHIAFDDKGDLKGSVITLNDFKDKKREVLDVVKP